MYALFVLWIADAYVSVCACHSIHTITLIVRKLSVSFYNESLLMMIDDDDKLYKTIYDRFHYRSRFTVLIH